MSRHAAGHPVRGRRPLVDRLLALLSLLVILLVLVAIPAALLALRGNPLPDGGTDLRMLLDRLLVPDDGSLFLAALTWIAWLAWASFALSVAVETIAQARGLPSPRLPALGPQQHVASVLVAAAALLFTAPLLHAAAAAASTHSTPSPPATPVSTGSSTLAPHTDAHAASHAASHGASNSMPGPAAPDADGVSTAAADSPPPGLMYAVRPGDSLWRIAQTTLGDGARYTEIAELNYGRRQSDGRSLGTDHWLAPGWTLLLPADAAVPGARADSEQPTTVIVEPGDTLWQIAQEVLGDGDRYPEIAAASTDLQPDGGRLRDPNLIRPGWRLTVPAPPATAPAASTSPADTTSPSAPVIAPQAPAAPPPPPPPAKAPPPPARSAPGAPTASTGSATAPGAHPVQQADPVQDGGDIDVDEPVDVRTAAGIGALLAASLLTMLGAKRARQQRRRRPGQRIAMPDRDLAPAELALRQVEDPGGQGRLDQALRTLSLRLAEAGGALPALRLVRLTVAQLELYLAEPAMLPAPFTPTGDPAVWTLAADAPLATAAEVAQVPAPYPSLVTLGQDLDGAHVLLDLEHAGSLHVVGDRLGSVAVLAALAAELATSAWADDLQVTVVGCLPELPAALGTGRLRHVSDLGELLRALEQRQTAVRAALAATGLQDLQHARSATAAGPEHAGAWTPEIVVVAGPVSPADHERLASVLLDQPRVGAAGVTTGAKPLSEWTLTLNATDDSLEGTAVLEPVGLSLRPQLLRDGDLEQLLRLLAVADQPAHLADEPTSTGLVVDEPDVTQLGIYLVQVPDEDDAAHPEASPKSSADVDESSAGSGEPGAAETDPPAAQLSAVGRSELHQWRDTTGTGAAADTVGEEADTAGEDGSAEAPPGGAAEHVAPPLVQLLGPVEVLRARGTVERSKQRQLTEIAAYLALNPGLDHLHLSEAIWPGARTLDNTRNTAVSKLRKWLGTNPAGEDYVPRALQDGYRLHPDVRSDWDLWRALLPEGPAAADTRDLTAALDLVRGKPFAGTNPRRYAWAERQRQDMISAIVDVAHELARRALLDGNARLARSAAAAGLEADPGAELLWRDALRAEWLAGDRTGLTATADRLSALADDLGDDLEPETIDLLEQLLNHPSRQVTNR
jgi:nucleoid-associated protein YgaU/DNA-binding SARP family transcriptional activator